MIREEQNNVRQHAVRRWWIPSGVRLPQITGAIDLLPTLAGLAGVQLRSPKPLDGIDLTAKLKSDTGEKADQWPSKII